MCYNSSAMSTISYLRPYTEQINNPPPAKWGVFPKFPSWLAAGIDPQKFWIPTKGYEVIVKIDPKINIYDFKAFAEAVLSYSNGMKNGIQFEEKTFSIDIEDEIVRNTVFKRFTFYRDPVEYRNNYIKKCRFLQKVEDKILTQRSFDLETISTLKPLTQEVKEWIEKCKELIPKVVTQDVDSIAAAAWIHHEVVRLHPFEARNRRIARVLANAFLQLGGHVAIFFPDRKKLHLAISADLEHPGHLAKFYEKVLRWNILQGGLGLDW